MNAWTHAVGWAGLFNGFAGKTTKKISPVDLLPYPEELKPKNRITDETAKILLKVLSQINPKYVGLLGDIITEAIEMTKKG